MVCRMDWQVTPFPSQEAAEKSEGKSKTPSRVLYYPSLLSPPAPPPFSPMGTASGGKTWAGCMGVRVGAGPQDSPEPIRVTACMLKPVFL